MDSNETNSLIKKIKSGFTSITSKEDCTISQGQFILALAAVLLASVLVNLWIRVINNFAFNFLKLDQDSLFWSLIVALIATGILVLFLVIAFDENTSNQIKGNLTGLTFGSTVTNNSNFAPNDGSDIDNFNNNS